MISTTMYTFPDGISVNQWNWVVESLKQLYPDIRWNSGRNLSELQDGFNPNNVRGLIVKYSNVDGYRLLYVRESTYLDYVYHYGITSHQIQDGSLLLNNFDSDTYFPPLNESENGNRYTEEDLEFFYKNKTLFYEINPKTGVPFPADEFHIEEGIPYDDIGTHYWVGKTGDYYDICWDNKKRLEGYDCMEKGPDGLIRNLNSGRLIPVDFYNPKISSHDLFDSLNESENGGCLLRKGDKVKINWQGKPRIGYPNRGVVVTVFGDNEYSEVLVKIDGFNGHYGDDSEECINSDCWYHDCNDLVLDYDYDKTSKLFESEDNWWEDVIKDYHNLDVEEGEWKVVDEGQHYPGNITLFYYFNISNIRDKIDKVALDNGIVKSDYDLTTEEGIEEYTNRIERVTGWSVYSQTVPKDIIGDRYDGDGLENGDICLKFKGEWNHKTHWSREPVYHMMRLKDKAHFVIGKSGVKRKEPKRVNESKWVDDVVKEFIYKIPLKPEELEYYWPHIIRALKERHPGIMWGSNDELETDDFYSHFYYHKEGVVLYITTGKKPYPSMAQSAYGELGYLLKNGYIEENHEIFELSDLLNIDTEDIFNKINESEEFDWFDDIKPPVEIGDVFYIVDRNPHSMEKKSKGYKPKNVRYIITIADIILNEKDINQSVIKYKPCRPTNVTYNPKDYSSESVNCYDYVDLEADDIDENGYEDVDLKWFIENLLNTEYWRFMGNSL